MTAQGRKGQISTTKNNTKGKWTPQAVAVHATKGQKGKGGIGAKFRLN